MICDAAEREDISVVSSLLSEGVDINGKNRVGDTPLHRASYGGNDSVVSLLVERGANLTIKNTVRITLSLLLIVLIEWENFP